MRSTYIHKIQKPKRTHKINEAANPKKRHLVKHRLSGRKHPAYSCRNEGKETLGQSESQAISSNPLLLRASGNQARSTHVSSDSKKGKHKMYTNFRRASFIITCAGSASSITEQAFSVEKCSCYGRLQDCHIPLVQMLSWVNYHSSTRTRRLERHQLWRRKQLLQRS